jgi:hypothetical protein
VEIAGSNPARVTSESFSKPPWTGGFLVLRGHALHKQLHKSGDRPSALVQGCGPAADGRWWRLVAVDRPRVRPEAVPRSIADPAANLVPSALIRKVEMNPICPLRHLASIRSYAPVATSAHSRGDGRPRFRRRFGARSCAAATMDAGMAERGPADVSQSQRSP